MHNKEDSYIVELKRPHLEWGTYRYTNTRNKIYDKAYVHIPSNHARNFNILKGSIFICASSDGFIDFDVKMQEVVKLVIFTLSSFNEMEI